MLNFLVSQGVQLRVACPRHLFTLMYQSKAERGQATLPDLKIVHVSVINFPLDL